MGYNGYAGFLFLFLILTIGLIASPYLAKLTEGFVSNGTFSNGNGDPLLDSFPSTGEKNVNNDTYYEIWKDYPSFNVSSYEQITNNLRYRKNPDDGKCIDANFCNVLYDDVEPIPNIITPLPPVINESGLRVNYYRTPINLLLGDQPGPLIDLPAF